VTAPMPSTHRQFVAALKELADPDAVAGVARFVRDDAPPGAKRTKVLGVSPGDVFPVAKRFADLPLADVERLLESPYYEVRLGAVAIMDFQARAKRTSSAHREALFDLYLRRHDRIDNWDLVDRAAPHVVGGWLADKPRDVLYELARSDSPSERRTAIVATWFFIRADDLDDTLRVAEQLVGDEHDLVQKAVGSWLREAGKRDQPRLVRFLRTHAPTMPRTMLRYAIEHLDKEERKHYLSMKKAG
jgi:3-methyladenine DNA glycosylase AlkD